MSDFYYKKLSVYIKKDSCNEVLGPLRSKWPLGVKLDGQTVQPAGTHTLSDWLVPAGTHFLPAHSHTQSMGC